MDNLVASNRGFSRNPFYFMAGLKAWCNEKRKSVKNIKIKLPLVKKKDSDNISLGHTDTVD